MQSPGVEKELDKPIGLFLESLKPWIEVADEVWQMPGFIGGVGHYPEGIRKS